MSIVLGSSDSVCLSIRLSYVIESLLLYLAEVSLHNLEVLFEVGRVVGRGSGRGAAAGWHSGCCSGCRPGDGLPRCPLPRSVAHTGHNSLIARFDERLDARLPRSGLRQTVAPAGESPCLARDPPQSRSPRAG